jgi:hypothetical protein
MQLVEPRAIEQIPHLVEGRRVIVLVDDQRDVVLLRYIVSSSR